MSLSTRFALSAVLVVSLAAGAAAQDASAPSGQEKVAANPDFPFEGEVTCDALNVRFLPKKDEGGIATILHQGDKIVVVGEDADYYQVRSPKGATVWIFAKHVKKDSETEGTVTVNDAPLRLDSRSNAEKLGSLNEGVKVTLLREHLGWYLVAAPEEVRYWVARKYVKFSAPATGEAAKPVAKTVKVGADAEARALLRQADELIAEQNALLKENRVSDLDYSAIIAAYEAAKNTARDAELKRRAEQGAVNYKNFQTILVGVKGNLKTVNELVDKLNEDLRARYEKPAKQWDMMGYVDTVGSLLQNRPGQYKLVMGGKIVCFISVKDGDDDMKRRLNSNFEKYVGIKGTVTQNPYGWNGYSVVAITDIEEILNK